ncbi:fungal-specific transcription factor domain-containing protein [Trichoderma austrokoningii]
MDRDEIDRVLRRKRKPTEKACYPCHRRKVRCNHGQPCSTCQRRGYPEICSYSFSATKRREKRRRHGIDKSIPAAEGPITSRQNNSGEAVNDSLLTPSLKALENSLSFANGEAPTPADHTYQGDNSIVSMLRQRVADPPPSSRIRDARVFFGLQNSLSSDLLFTVPALQQRWETLVCHSPQNEEFHSFFPSYRHTAYPFMPFLIDIDHFEIRVCKYLESCAAGQLQDKLRPSDPWATDEGVTFVALILAVLSCGSHFSMLPVTQRSEASRDFVRRGFQVLQLANYMLRPSLDAVQTLLILGNTLQNIGQSDGAWVLLGTTVRLAQALGLHTENGAGHSESDTRSRRALWAAIVWQDCFLSVCHGRPTSVSNIQVQNLYCDNTPRSFLSYAEVMRSIAFICFEVTESNPDAERSARLVQSIDDCISHAYPYLQTRESCKNLRELLEYLALQINTSFTICFLCRPAINKSTPMSHGASHRSLIVRAQRDLQNVLERFLEFEALSIVPLRSWSMIHSALTSMLLLSIWEETRNDSKSYELQKSVLNVLLKSSQHEVSLEVNPEPHWLSAKHVRALMNLLETTRNTSCPTTGTLPNQVSRISKDQSSRNRDQVPENIISTDLCPIADQIYDTFDQISPNESEQFPWMSTELSPFAYVDEIMNVLFYDTTQV